MIHDIGTLISPNFSDEEKKSEKSYIKCPMWQNSMKQSWDFNAENLIPDSLFNNN